MNGNTFVCKIKHNLKIERTFTLRMA